MGFTGKFTGDLFICSTELCLYIVQEITHMHTCWLCKGSSPQSEMRAVGK